MKINYYIYTQKGSPKKEIVFQDFPESIYENYQDVMNEQLSDLDSEIIKFDDVDGELHLLLSSEEDEENLVLYVKNLLEELL